MFVKIFNYNSGVVFLDKKIVIKSNLWLRLVRQFSD